MLTAAILIIEKAPQNSTSRRILDHIEGSEKSSDISRNFLLGPCGLPSDPCLLSHGQLKVYSSVNAIFWQSKAFACVLGLSSHARHCLPRISWLTSYF